MRKRFLPVLLSALILATGLQTQASESIQEVHIPANSSETMTAALEIDQEVEHINTCILNSPLSNMVVPWELTDISADQLRTIVSSCLFPQTGCFLDGQPCQQSDLNAIIERRSLSQLSDPVHIRYGILTDNAAVRLFPSWQKLSETSEPDGEDLFQVSMLTIGEGIAVLHQTSDQVWSFVRSANAIGWIETAKIAFCLREEMKAYCQSYSFVVVTDEYLVSGNYEFRMGTRLPAIYTGTDTVTVQIPHANDSGNLYQTEQTLYLEDGVHWGYLPLSGQNVINQAKKIIASPYGYKDSGGYFDEISMVDAVYRCFGIQLPRTAPSILASGLSSVSLIGMSSAEKSSCLSGFEAGGILISEDYAAIFAGTAENGSIQIVTMLQTYSPDGINYIRSSSCQMIAAESLRDNGSSFLESFQFFIPIR